MKTRGLICSAIFLSVALMISGCSSTAAKRTQDGLELDLKRSDKEGYAILKVISTGAVGMFNSKWLAIKVTSVSGGLGTEMYDVTQPGGASTESLYFAKLNAGEYAISGLESIGPMPGLLPALMTGSYAKADKLPNFLIKPGELANLGTLVYVPPSDKDKAAQMFILQEEKGKKAAHEMLMIESKRSSIPLPPGGGWINKTAIDESPALEQARAALSPQYFQRTQKADVAGSYLGTIFHRTGTQQWAVKSLDTLSSLYAVAIFKNGTLVAGGDYGVYFVKSANEPLRTFRLPAELSRINHIEIREDESVLFVAGDAQETRIWHKPKIDMDSSAAKEVVNLKTPSNYLLVTPTEFLFAQNIPGISRESVITRVDKRTFEARTQKEGFWVIDWNYQQNKGIILTRMNGLSMYPSISEDGAKTWKHSDRQGFFSVLWLNDMEAYSLDISPGLTTVDNQVGFTADGGKSWTKLGAPITTMSGAKIIYAGNDEILLQANGALLSSTDKAASWKRLFPASASN